MPQFRAAAPGKMILFGEHAVVYGRPAIAAPVELVSAQATISAAINAAPGAVWVDAPDIRLHTALDRLPADHPLALAIHGVQEALVLRSLPAMRVAIRSTIPIAGGLGSGAAVSVALIRALCGFLGHPLPDDRINELTYRVEQRLHGTPSGIDNTVITYRRPIIFQRGRPFEVLRLGAPLTFVIADSGVRSPTGVVVGDVRQAWQAEPARFDGLFDRIAGVVDSAREALSDGFSAQVGACMDENQALLEAIGVSSPALEQLVCAARAAGALGAKLSGAGRGGNVLALVHPATAETVAGALTAAGAVRTITTALQPEDR